jgi:hypothetical protein
MIKLKLKYKMKILVKKDGEYTMLLKKRLKKMKNLVLVMDSNIGQKNKNMLEKYNRIKIFNNNLIYDRY